MLIFSMISSKSSSLRSSMSFLFGTYCRIRPVVFSEVSFLRVIGMCKEPLGSQFECDFFMISKFSAVVIGHGENSIPIGFQIITDCIHDSPRCFIGGLGGNDKSRFPLNKCQKDSVSLFADHSICFPIPNTVAQVNYFRAFLNGYFIFDLATPLQ